MVKFTFRGLMVPAMSAFKDDLSVNFAMIESYAKFLADFKMKGVLVNGTTGEGMSLSVDERKSITEEWMKAAKKTNLHLMIQIGGVPLPHVLELAKHAESIGAHSLLSLPDVFNKPNTISDLLRYLTIVGAAAPKTPLLYYHNPGRTNVNIHMGQFLDKSAGKIPTFHGIKFTSAVLDEGMDALKANDSKYVVFLGVNKLMAGAYALGFDSTIASILTVFPQEGKDILKAVEQSKLHKAREIQDKLSKICSIIANYGPWVPALKIAMNLCTPVRVGKAREPLLNLTEEKIKQMEVELKNVGAIK